MSVGVPSKGCTLRVPRLRGAPEVEVEESAETFTTLDRQVVVGQRRHLRELLLLETLVAPLEMVVLHELGHGAPKVAFTVRNELAQRTRT